MSVILSTRQASAAVLISAVAWGLYWIPLRGIEGVGLAGPQVALLLNAPAALAVVLWATLTWRQQRGHLVDAGLIGLFGGVGLALWSLALIETTVIRATLLFYLMPVWGTALGMLWLGEQAGWARFAAIASGLAGLGLLILGAPQGNAMAFNPGDLMALGAGWGWAIAAALVKRRGSVPVAGMLAAQFVCLVLTVLGVGALLGAHDWPEAAQLRAVLPLSLAVALLGVVPATAAILWASKFLYPGRVGLLLMGEVAVAVVSASLLLPEERLSALQWGAVALILGAGVLELIPSPPRGAAAPSRPS